MKYELSLASNSNRTCTYYAGSEAIWYDDVSDLYFYEYSKFRIANESDKYRLTVGALINKRTWENYAREEFLLSNGKEFSFNTNRYCDLSLVPDAG